MLTDLYTERSGILHCYIILWLNVNPVRIYRGTCVYCHFTGTSLYHYVLHRRIQLIFPYFGRSSLYLAHFGPNHPIKIELISFFILYISLFKISNFPTNMSEFPSLFNHSPYLKKKISLSGFPNISHVLRRVP